MRIDIHPDFLSQSLAEKKSATGLISDNTDFITRTGAGSDRPLKYVKLLESIYDAVVITDLKGRIIDYNSRAMDFFLSDTEALSSTNIIDLISGADMTLLNSIKKNLEDHRYTLIEAYCIRSDKSMFPAEIAANNIDIDEEGQLSFFIRDISIRKRAQEALEEAVTSLEAHDRARWQFISNVSHELRTPLTSMTYAVANMLRGVVGTLPDRVRQYLEIMAGDCKRLLGTVNDILDLRKIEDNTLTLAKARVPFARLVNRGIDSLRVQADQKSQELNVITDEKRRFVDCDAHKMERVVLNLVGNALKFTPESGAIDVTLTDHPDRPEHVLLAVQDTGTGIDPSAIDRVTERYFTVGEQPSGSGLGLAISKEIVELHGGTIEIESPPPGADRGTVVRITMPQVTPPTVLIVEDNEAIQDLLAEQMSAQGYTITKADGGLDALDMMGKEKPDIVILDLVLPEVEGTEVIIRMKSANETMRIPIVVVTGAHVGRAKGQILRNYAIPALSKPWQEWELLDRVEGAFLGAAVLNR